MTGPRTAPDEDARAANRAPDTPDTPDTPGAYDTTRAYDTPDASPEANRAHPAHDVNTETPMHQDSAATGAIGVVGAGTMGVGIAQCLAEAGHRVVAVDPEQAALASAPARLRDGIRLATMFRKAPAAVPLRQALEAVTWTTSLADLASARFVLDCAPERIPLKERLFRELDEICPPPAVFATVTSAIPVDRLAAHTGRAGQVIGTHFMNPAPLKDTVEVIRGPRTSDATLDTTLALLADLGKKGIVVNDAPGFVSNRVLMLTVNEAATVVQQGTADPAAVDRIFQDCFGHTMGPLATGDLIGLDTIVDTLDVLLECTGDPRFQPCEKLRQLVADGHLGRKSGQGFHRYPAPAHPARTSGGPTTPAQPTETGGTSRDAH
ncbi:3-hydroxyacyl-CoA dehydrogenase family protein [Streptomyces sp. G45]|uniref:3-hydroxyacyl-CoA dehydrogenase family protein n=1 Tax=Streptomyces sp. G45 TaxID=3406627 RepID=UPI003C17E211